MRSEMPSSSSNAQLNNELDIAGLFLMLWRGKHWIVAMAAIFALIALIYSFLVKQEWTATAITDRPTITLLGNDFSQQQFLRNLDVKNSPVSTSNTVPIEDDAYQEFIRQLSSYDTKRDFWLQSSYLAARVTGKRHHDAKLLDEMNKPVKGDAAPVQAATTASIRVIRAAKSEDYNVYQEIN